MNLTRRKLLAAATVTSSAAFLSGCRSLEQLATPVEVDHDAAVSRPQLTTVDATRLLGRAGYGHRPGDRSAVRTIGLEGFVDRQLRPETIAEHPVLTFRLRSLSDQLPNDFGLLFEQDDHALMGSLAQATLLRAVYSNRGLLERTTEFWADHFNIYSYKGERLPQYVVLFHLNILQPYALTTFRELLAATAHSAAILTYLDNETNRAGRPNENYARELMELHTLGIHGGYTQRDVQEVARCLTGWTVNQKFRPASFEFAAHMHDTGAKKVLGRAVIPNGQQEMEGVLDTLATHPATSHHIAGKLLQRFRGDSQRDHREHVASVFRKTDGDIRSTLRAVLVDCGVLDAPPIMKRPFDFVASALRATDSDTDCGAGIISFLEKMGQPMFQWPRPDGFPDRSASWANCLSARWQFALNLAAGKLPNTSIPWKALVTTGSNCEITDHLFAAEDNAVDLQELRAAAAGRLTLEEFTSLGLMSPSFQWR